MPRSPMIACQRLHFAPTNSCHLVLPLLRMPTSTIKKHTQRKAVSAKQNFRKARVCCGLCGSIPATESAPVHRNTSGKESRTTRRTTKLGSRVAEQVPVNAARPGDQPSSVRRASSSERACWSPFFAAAAMPLERICLASVVRDSRVRSWAYIRYAGT